MHDADEPDSYPIARLVLTVLIVGVLIGATLAGWDALGRVVDAERRLQSRVVRVVEDLLPVLALPSLPGAGRADESVQ